MDASIKSPQECTAIELDKFEELVREGGEVTVRGLRQRIEKSERLIFIINENKRVAVGAIKNPNDGYKSGVFSKAGVLERSNEFKYELGWLYVTPSERHKGLGRCLMNVITEFIRNAGCYATTREDNASMHYLLGQYSFTKLGSVYSSEKGYSLVLYANRP